MKLIPMRLQSYVPCRLSLGEFGSASISDLKVSLSHVTCEQLFKQKSPRDAFGTIRHTFFPSVSNTQFLPPVSLSCRDEKSFPRVIDRGRQKMCTTSRQKAENSRKTMLPYYDNMRFQFFHNKTQHITWTHNSSIASDVWNVKYRQSLASRQSNCVYHSLKSSVHIAIYELEALKPVMTVDAVQSRSQPVTRLRPPQPAAWIRKKNWIFYFPHSQLSRLFAVP